jgi:hypothetical protein
MHLTIAQNVITCADLGLHVKEKGKILLSAQHERS